MSIYKNKLAILAAVTVMAAAMISGCGNTSGGANAGAANSGAANAGTANAGAANSGAGQQAADGKIRQEEAYSYINFDDIFEQMKAEDLDGNQIDSSVFANADVTMVNIWGTFCSPCVKEMPDLGEISRAYLEDKNSDGSLKLQMIGIVGDTVAADRDGYMYVDTKTVSKAKDIVEKTKADYLHIVPTGNFGINLIGSGNISYFPSTIFVDSEGDIIETTEGEIVVGAHDKAAWEKLIKSVIAEEKD